MDAPRMSTPHATPLWHPLLPPAMVGTDKKTFEAPHAPGAVGSLLGQLHAQDCSPAQALLQAAGVLAVCERAAQRPVAQLPASPHGVAAQDTAQTALHDGALIDTVRWLLTDAPLRLQIEGLQQVAARGWRLPHSLLPLALDSGLRTSALRPALLAVLGERGRWLACHHSAWRYAAATAETAPWEVRWQEGTLAQRVQLLHEERHSQPAAARERLQAALPDLPAKERAELLAVLQTGLSADDEALLTTLAQKDKGREVRQLARALLVQLPGSASTQAAIARLQPCVQAAAEPQLWCVVPPEVADPDWKHHGIELERPKHESLGERAWWLYQLARQVPLAWWQQHTGMAPEALLHWARQGDWHAALVRAWWDVLRPAPDAAWCHALLQHWPGKALPDSPAAVLALLPAAQREPYWTQTLWQVNAGKVSLFNEVAEQILQACPPGEHVSEALSRLLLHKLLLARRHSYLRVSVDELCCVLHPALLPVLREPTALDRLVPPLSVAESVSAHAITYSLSQVLGHSLQVIAARCTLAQWPSA